MRPETFDTLVVIGSTAAGAFWAGIAFACWLRNRAEASRGGPESIKMGGGSPVPPRVVWAPPGYEEVAEKLLASVADHETEKARTKFDRTPGYASGVACPECGAELYRFVGGVRMLEAHGGRYPCFCRKCCHETTIA